MSVGLRHNNSPHDRSCNLEPCRAGAGRRWASPRLARAWQNLFKSPCPLCSCGESALWHHAATNLVVVAVHFTSPMIGSGDRIVRIGGKASVWIGHHARGQGAQKKAMESESKCREHIILSPHAPVRLPVSIDPGSCQPKQLLHPGRLFFFGRVQSWTWVALRRR
jgi:hypothetical protein